MEERIQQAVLLLEEKKYNDAEKLLFQLRKEDYKNEKINFYLGVLFSTYDNPDNSKEKAKRFFQDVVNGEYVYEYAFIYLAKFEGNKNQSLRLIKKGLEVFPDSHELIEMLLVRSPDEEKENIFQDAIKKDICSNDIYNYMFSYYYGYKKYQEAYEIAKKMKSLSKNNTLLIELAKGFCFYRMNEFSKAKSSFNLIINEDVNRELSYFPLIGAILCNLKQEELEIAFEMFDEIPFDSSISAELFSYPQLVFSFDTELLEFFKELQSRTKKTGSLAKIKGLRGLYLSNFNDKRAVKDLEYANKYLPNNLIYIEALKSIAESNVRNRDAFNYGLSLIKHTYIENEEYLESEYFWHFIKNSDLEDVLEMKKELISFITADSFNVEVYSGKICEFLIEKLYSLKRYEEIIEIYNHFNLQEMKGDFLFEVAYSFSIKGDINLAKETYELHQKKKGESNATLNNLGVIYRKQNNLYKAQEMFRKAVSLNADDKTALNNLEVVTKLIVEQQQEEEELYKAASTFNLENAWLKGKLIAFSNQRNKEGLIICPYSQLPRLLSVTEIRANELIKTFLEKKYVFKVTNHNLGTNSSVYRINSKIIDMIEDLLTKNQREIELISIAENFNIEQYSNIGFDERLLKYLNKVSSPDLKSMLERDINENVTALITKSYKTALIMSGSIVEAVLLDHLTSKNIASHTLENGKAKKVNQMDLNELLYVANKEGYIEPQLYHLAHAIRGFRNLIHPGVEKRKASIVVNEDNAILAWGIVKKVIQEI
ncbi:tetratricopeptide repeat protein [Paenibacillus radicis (ex Gao et al. 2016)]|uniref:DUF4145 domain-containing protein n=1 Tax=Paenibacillus radicis (ex Gao et al. 2016) TaxID=1737354 RepID=A0A917HKX3_9BACL|nr:hypothetical protein [Paenibacillus radicis (ex Gao et al. 2016)]GGG81997.1 hypothetical protein GCM10010918_44150 [Paenibacillus radicis (ex Gao et al. 2016)]